MKSCLETGRLQRLSGFGQADFADAYVYRPATLPDVKAILQLAKDSGHKIVLRGAGRSYGDAAILGEGIALDLTRMNRILSWDRETGQVECEPGVTIENLWRYCLEDGWWPPVVSGTMYPTLGGALAMNIHGKNNPKAGTLGEHVLELDFLLADGSVQTLTPNDDLFYAAIGGFGTFGVIVRVVLQMKKVTSGNVKVLATAPRNWREQIETFEQFEPDADYMVSWIDCFAKGAQSGRGQFHAAWYEHPAETDWRSLTVANQDLPDTILGLIPKSAVWKYLKKFNNRVGVRLVNSAKDFSSRTVSDHKTITQGLVAFSFLLDYVPRWRDSYLPGGFIQYQSFIPKDHAEDVFKLQIEAQGRAKIESYLGVMKRHRPDKFLVSHAVDGYSLALDFKVTKRNQQRLVELCHEMNDIVLAAGGRLYFAKDSTLRPQDVRAYLGPETIAKIESLKASLDPNGIFSSSLSQRLFGF